MEPNDLEVQLREKYREELIRGRPPSESQFLRDFQKVLFQKDEITFSEYRSLASKFTIETINEFLDEFYALADRYAEEEILLKYKPHLPQIKQMLRGKIMMISALMPSLINVFRYAFFYLLDILSYCRISNPRQIKSLPPETQELWRSIMHTVLCHCCEICTSDIVAMIGPLDNHLGDGVQSSMATFLNSEKEKIDPSTLEDFCEYLSDKDLRSASSGNPNCSVM